MRSLTGYSRSMDDDESVSIGAYARRRRLRRTLLALMGVALIVGAWLLYRALLPRDENAGGSQYPVRVRCGACGFTAVMAVPASQTFAMVCPQCGERACRPLWKCRECGTEFLPERGVEPVHCPSCRSVQVGSAAAP